MPVAQQAADVIARLEHPGPLAGRTGGCDPRFAADTADHIKAGYSVECGSDAEALRAARTLLGRSAVVEVWRSDQCVAHLGVEARHLESDA